MKDTTGTTTFVGLDVHKEAIAVAVARAGQEPESLGVIPNTPESVAKLARRLGAPKTLRVCYEAGPCGYAIFRQLLKLGIECVVVAPSLVPQRAGDRVKTDRRDALKLARLHRSGELVPVWVPDEAQEALRDLVRAREDVIEDRLRKRHQLSKFLLRLELRPPVQTRAWSSKFNLWLQGLKLAQPVQQIVLREYIHALHEVKTRLKRLEAELAEMAQNCPHAAVIAALQSLRGVELLTAATFVAELGDLTRFNTAQQLMAYAGLVPSEHSSGGSQRRGGITKCGTEGTPGRGFTHDQQPGLESAAQVTPQVSPTGWPRKTKTGSGGCGGQRIAGVCMGCGSCGLQGFRPLRRLTSIEPEPTRIKKLRA